MGFHSQIFLGHPKTICFHNVFVRTDFKKNRQKHAHGPKTNGHVFQKTEIVGFSFGTALNDAQALFYIGFMMFLENAWLWFGDSGRKQGGNKRGVQHCSRTGNSSGRLTIPGYA
jgi:hypothetical protein